MFEDDPAGSEAPRPGEGESAEGAPDASQAGASAASERGPEKPSLHAGGVGGGWFPGGMFEEVPTDPEWHVPDDSELTGEEQADWIERVGGFTQEHLLADRIARSRVEATRLIADQYAVIDQLRLEAEQVSGASWSEPDSLAWRSLRAEVAGLLQVHERTAERILELSRQLVHRFPDTLTSLGKADFTDRHARILVEEATGLPDEFCAEYEARLLPYARTLVPSRLAAIAATVRAQLSPRDLIEAHQEALTVRRTAIERGPDGMAWYGGYLEAGDAIGAAAGVNGLARTLKNQGDPRTLAQIEADVFRDLLTDPGGLGLPAVAGGERRPTPAAQRGIRPEVALHVPVLTAMGRSDDPAVLEGYGPIDADTARRMAGTAPGWIRILTDPETGTVLSVGRTRYRPPADLRRHLWIRDEVCTFPGCARPARDCDLDHTMPWEEHGETVDANLAHLCPSHHQVKHGSRWRVRQTGTGMRTTITWTSPAGRTYTSSPVVKLPPTRNSKRPGAPPIVQTEWAKPDESPPPPF
jgi:hypothetical protein